MRRCCSPCGGCISWNTNATGLISRAENYSGCGMIYLRQLQTVSCLLTLRHMDDAKDAEWGHPVHAWVWIHPPGRDDFGGSVFVCSGGGVFLFCVFFGFLRAF